MPPPRGLLQQLDQHWHRHASLPRRATLLVACSGGADSVALLRLLHAANRSDYWHWTLVVAHVDHAVRPDSARDAAFVADLAETLGLQHVSHRLRWPAPPRAAAPDIVPATPRVSEAALRKARYAALARLARQVAADAVVLAHHADDQTETVLLRLLRGTGLRGLAAMAPRTRWGGDNRHLPLILIRPLLHVPRADLIAYLRQINQPWREDPTNTSRAYLRNRVRHDLLPLLTVLQPQVRQRITRLAGQARAADAMLSKRLAHLQRHADRPDPRTIRYPRTRLARAPQLLAAAALRQALIDLGVPPDRLPADAFTPILAALQTHTSGQRFTFPQGTHATLTRDHITLTRPNTS